MISEGSLCLIIMHTEGFCMFLPNNDHFSKHSIIFYILKLCRSYSPVSCRLPFISVRCESESYPVNSVFLSLLDGWKSTDWWEAWTYKTWDSGVKKHWIHTVRTDITEKKSSFLYVYHSHCNFRHLLHVILEKAFLLCCFSARFLPFVSLLRDFFGGFLPHPTVLYRWVSDL